MNFKEVIAKHCEKKNSKTVLSVSPDWEKLPDPLKKQYKSIGAALGGLLATHLGLRAPFGIAAAFFAAAALLAMATLRSFNAWEKTEPNSAAGSSIVSRGAGFE